MKKLQIKFTRIEDIRKFMNVLRKYTIGLYLHSGEYTVAAKSIMGIFTLDLMKPVDFLIDSENTKIVNSVIEDVKIWTA